MMARELLTRGGMDATRLKVALLGGMALGTWGCFGSHGTDVDGGVAPPDGALDGGAPLTCELRDGFISALTCVSPRFVGDTARVRIEHSTGVCCGESTARPTARLAFDGVWQVESAFDACDCCEACRCAALPVETELVLDIPYVPGAVHRVRGGDFECEIVIDELAICGPSRADEVILPRVLYTDQPVSATLTTSLADCGCAASAVFRGSSDPTPMSYELEMQLCDCCEACDCAAVGYQAGVVAESLPVGHYTVETPLGTRDLSVFDLDGGECQPIAPTGLRIVTPREDLVSAGPRLTWAVVSGVIDVCCAEPMGGVRMLDVAAVGTHLELRSCVTYDCDCIGSPTPFEAWYSLGELPSGSGDVVFAGDYSVTYVVP